MHDAMPIAEKKIGPFLLLHYAQFGLNPALHAHSVLSTESSISYCNIVEVVRTFGSKLLNIVYIQVSVTWIITLIEKMGTP
jgi:hypothetical protein